VRWVRHPIRWAREHPATADRLLAALVTVIGVVSHLVAWEHEGEVVAGPSVPGVLLCFGAAVPLAWRRAHPIPVLVVITVNQGALEVMNAEGPGWLGVLIAAYSLGRHHSGRRLWWIAGPFVGAIAVFVISGAVIGEAPWGAVVTTLVMVPAVVLFGDSMRMQRKRLDDLAERAERAERERELLARQHVQDERTRIARELHDVVAHSVSVMVIQAGAARRQLESNPERANTALEAIESTGRAAMIEMRRILGVLREHDGGAGPLAPAPSLTQIGDLVRADPDLAVTLRTEGDLEGVPSGVEVSAYRIVQEALTNVRRHAGRVDDVTVRVSRLGGRLEIEVTDDGRGASTLVSSPPAGSDDAGHGLIGMRERVASSGGELSAGPRPGGGWRVHAQFPVPDTLPEPAEPAATAASSDDRERTTADA